MALEYREVLPWGRSFAEYEQMFRLTPSDTRKKILGCADGPASFNAGMRKRGQRIVSCDPLYTFTPDQIRSRIAGAFVDVMAQTRKNAHLFVWSAIRSSGHLAQVRMEAMTDFLADYELASDGRYVAGELPSLPFAENSFDLALCSHFLFLYSARLSLTFHLRAVSELCRVAREVRIFPLVTLDAETSPHLDPLVDNLKRSGYAVALERVGYEFQRGGNMMMRIRHR